MGSDRETLIDMGFPPAKVDRALLAVKNAGLQPAMDWLVAHADDLEDAHTGGDPGRASSGRTLGASSSSAAGGSAAAQAVAAASGASTEREDGEIRDGEQTAQSLQCDDCTRLFRDGAAAERHAIKTAHANFSESTTAIKPLTEEEKKAKLAELKAKLAEKRAARAAETSVSDKEAERLRRKAGQDLTDVKQQMEEKEMQKMLEQKKREKLEEAKAKAAIKAKIEQDKAERAAKRNANAKRAEEAQIKAETVVVKTPTATKDYNDARLQIRKPDGSTIVQTFRADDKLAAVYEFVKAQYTGDFNLTTTFPRKVLGGTEMTKTLRDLTLVPSAALVMSTL